ASGPNVAARLRRSVDRGPHPCVEQATSPSRKARHLTIEGTENDYGRSEPMRDQWLPVVDGVVENAKRALAGVVVEGQPLVEGSARGAPTVSACRGGCRYIGIESPHFIVTT